MKNTENKNRFGRFQVAVGALIEDASTGKILILQRKKDDPFDPDGFELVYGRLLQSEEIEAGLLREIQEETGISNIEIVRQLSFWHIFRGEELPENEVVGLTFWCQTNISQVNISEEHQGYEWVSPENILAKIKLAGVKADVEECLIQRTQLLEWQSAAGRAQRALADYQNLVKRVIKEKQDLTHQVGVELVTQLLSPVSHLKLAASELKDQGLAMVVKEFDQTLTQLGLREISPVGEQFDVNTMEAVKRQGKGEKVIQVIKPGYWLNDRVIQHAKVIVG
jgi:molecular chaperone GrpE